MPAGAAADFFSKNVLRSQIGSFNRPDAGPGRELHRLDRALDDQIDMNRLPGDNGKRTRRGSQAIAPIALHVEQIIAEGKSKQLHRKIPMEPLLILSLG